MIPRVQSNFSVPTPSPQVGGEAQAYAGVLQVAKSGINEAQARLKERLAKKQQADDATAYIAATNQYTLGLTELEQRLQNEAPESGDGYLRSVRENRKSLRENVISGLSETISPEARQQISNALLGMDGDSDVRATRWQDAALSRHSGAVYESALNTTASQVMANPADLDQAMARQYTALDAISGRLGPEQQEALRARTALGLTKAAVTGLSQSGQYGQARELIKKNAADIDIGQQKQLNQIVDRMEATARDEAFDARQLAIYEGQLNRSQLSELHKQGLIKDDEMLRHTTLVDQVERQAQAAHEAAMSKAQAENFARLQVGIERGTMTAADADALYKKKMITPSQWSQAVRQQRQAAEKQTAAYDVAVKLRENVPLDPRDSRTQSGIDELFAQSGGIELLQSDPQAGFMAIAQFADVGVIPTQARSSLRGMMASGTPDQQKTALSVIGSLYNNYQHAVDAAFSEKELAEAISYRDKLDAGIDEKAAWQAIEHERQAANERGGVHDMRQAQARAISKDLDLSEALKRRDADGKGGVLGLFSGEKVGTKARAGQDFAGDEIAKAQITNDFREAFETYYLISGDEKLAKRQAAMVMQRTVGESNANNGMVMMHPPEKYYGFGPQDDGKWMKRAIEAELSKRAGGLKSYQLVSDRQTAQEARAGLAPTYFVMVTERDGRQVPLPQRWSFEGEREKHLETLQKEADAAITDTREKALAKDRKTAERALESIAALKTGVAWPNMTPEQKAPYLESERMWQERLAMRDDTMGEP